MRKLEPIEVRVEHMISDGFIESAGYENGIHIREKGLSTVMGRDAWSIEYLGHDLQIATMSFHVRRKQSCAGRVRGTAL